MTAAEQAACLAEGGRSGRTLLGMACFRPTADVGKQCSEQTECSTICLSALETGAATGTCAPETPKIGCFEMLDENG
jgi:hypothetical protein